MVKRCKKVAMLMIVVCIINITCLNSVYAKSSTDKKFSFDIKYSVTSSAFSIKYKNVNVKTGYTRFISDIDGSIQSSGSKRIGIKFTKKGLTNVFWSKSVTSKVSSGIDKTWKGWNTSDKYYVKINNVDDMPDYWSLVGSGKVTSSN